ncbi:MAG: BrnT family toxin [Anaerolineales bacterium]|nr:BrnT family toxin [Anaerolineales bacterium]
MEFEWDDYKEQSNYSKHRIRFRQIIPAFFDPRRLEYEDPEQSEERIRLIGQVHGRVVFVVYTWRGENVRIISARKATKDEQEKYNAG